MPTVSRSFQIFVKPVGAACNLNCSYCYYLSKARLGSETAISRMAEGLLERYIAEHIAASFDEVIRFSWHGGEPTLLGLDYFRRIVAIERRCCPEDRAIANGIQTNGTLIDEAWAEFLAAESFAVGLSLDGPPEMHDQYRTTRQGRPTFAQALRAYELLRRHGVPTDILFDVGSPNAGHPAEVYGFFKQIGALYVSFIPLVERRPDRPQGASAESVQPWAWGDFLCAVFDEWVAGDIGRIKVQIIEEAARTAFGQEHSLCLFRPTCGDIPVVERNGDFYSCDHFVDDDHRVGNVSSSALVDLLESPAQRAFGLAKLDRLPEICRVCEVLAMCHGECPKNRFVPAPGGGPPQNYLCPGYKQFFKHVTPFVQAVAAEWCRLP